MQPFPYTGIIFNLIHSIQLYHSTKSSGGVNSHLVSTTDACRLANPKKGHVVSEAELGRRGIGASFGSVLSSSGVIESWKELRRVLSDISRAGDKV